MYDFRICLHVFAVNDKEAFVSTLRAARNMSFQGIVTPRGHIDKLAESMVQRLLEQKFVLLSRSAGLRFADGQRPAYKGKAFY